MAARRTEGLKIRPSVRSIVLPLVVAVTVVFTYLAVRNARLEDVWAALRESQKVWLLPAAAVLVVAVVLRAVRWWSLYVPATRPPLRLVLRALLIGYFFNNVLPLRAGEAARVLVLNRDTGVSRAETAATVVIERAFDVVFLLLLLFAIVPWLPEVSWLRPAAVLLAVLGLGLAAVAFVLARYGERALRFALRPLLWLPFLAAARFETGVLNLTQGLAGIRRARIAIAASAWTLLSWLLVALSSWLVLIGFDLGLSFLAGLFVVIAINLASILPAPPAALGVFEAATVVALDAYGVGGSEALSYALVLHALNSFPFIVAGAVILFPGRRGRR